MVSNYSGKLLRVLCIDEPTAGNRNPTRRSPPSQVHDSVRSREMGVDRAKDEIVGGCRYRLATEIQNQISSRRTRVVCDT